MSGPRMRDSYAAAARDELVGLIERDTASPASSSGSPPGGRIRTVVAFAIALAIIVPGAVLGFALGAHRADVGHREGLSVVVDGSLRFDPFGDYLELVGTLRARRVDDTACFSIDIAGSGVEHGTFLLVLPKGYSASNRLALLDPSGAAVAVPDERVILSTTFGVVRRAAGACGTGQAIHVVQVQRADVAPTAAKAVTTPLSAGCPATSASIPVGAITGVIADVDGDGRRDTEWAKQLEGGALRFGITTASGATISGEQGFAGGGDRSFVVGRLANGVVVAITSENRESPVYSFSRCAFHRVRGRDLLPGTGASSPLVLYSVEAGGWGGCVAGALALLQPSGDTGGAIARRIDISADGVRATVTNRLSLVDRAPNGVSCDGSPVLRPVLQGPG